MLTSQPHDRRIDDGAHLADMLLEQAVEERFVAVLQRGEIDVALQVVLLAAEALVGANDLSLHRGNLRRKEAQQAQLAPLRFWERAAFVQQGLREDCPPGYRHFQDVLGTMVTTSL